MSVNQSLDPSVDSLYSHTRSDDPWWNESAWFGFSVPERNINGFFYLWHRPNMKTIACGVAIWDDIGTHRDDCLYYHWFPFNPLSPDADMFDFETSTGMSIKMREPLRSYELRHEAPGCSLDLLWEGVTPAYDVSFGSKPAASGAEDFGAAHYEQFGKVTGQLVLDGEQIDVDGYHVRDRSWGIRRPFLPKMRGGLDMCWFGDDLAFSATWVTPEADDFAVGATDKFAYGMMLRDGVLSTPVTGQRRVLERGPDGRPLALEIELEDAEGRRIEARGRMRNVLKYDDLWHVHWCLSEFESEGRRGWGETQDLVPREALRRYQRQALRSATV